MTTLCCYCWFSQFPDGPSLEVDPEEVRRSRTGEEKGPEHSRGLSVRVVKIGLGPRTGSQAKRMSCTSACAGRRQLGVSDHERQHSRHSPESKQGGINLEVVRMVEYRERVLLLRETHKIRMMWHIRNISYATFRIGLIDKRVARVNARIATTPHCMSAFS